MTKGQFDSLRAAIRGEVAKVPVGMIIDSPWIPGFTGLNTVEYYAEPEKWLKANIDIIERFPDVIFFPGFWVEYGMAIEPSAFGCKIGWWDDTPASSHPILTDISAVSGLEVPDMKYDGLAPMALHLQRWAQKEIAPLGYGIRMVAARGPLALAGHIHGITELLLNILVEPEHSHKLIDICTKTVIQWLRLQVQNLPEVEGILVLDDIVGMLSPAQYEEFAHPYLERICAEFPGMLKIYHNDANVDPFAERLPDTGFEALNFSHNIDIGSLGARIGDRMCLIGNVPPLHVLAQGTHEEVTSIAKDCLGKRNGRMILSAGGGASPGMPAENLDALVAVALQQN